MSPTRNAIKQWVRRIANSRLSVDEFFARHDVPFSRAQYFRYKQRLAEGKDLDPLQRGRKKKIGEREELFLKGVVASGTIPPLDELCNLHSGAPRGARLRAVSDRQESGDPPHPVAKTWVHGGDDMD